MKGPKEKWNERYRRRTGKPGEPDSTCELRYLEKGRKTTVTESITARREPDFLGGIYESNRGTTVTFNHFEETDDGKTGEEVRTRKRALGVAKAQALAGDSADDDDGLHLGWRR